MTETDLDKIVLLAQALCAALLLAGAWLSIRSMFGDWLPSRSDLSRAQENALAGGSPAASLPAGPKRAPVRAMDWTFAGGAGIASVLALGTLLVLVLAYH